jgi:hypothetical protein
VLNVPVVAPPPLAQVEGIAAGYPAVVLVDESRGAGSPASLLAATLRERGVGARMSLVCSGEAPSPFALNLLDAIVPTAERIAAAVISLTRGGDATLLR